MAESRKQNPISFAKVRKQTADGKFDLEATLGEIVKVTVNQSLPADAKESKEFKGTFRVTLENLRHFFIETDSTHDQLELLKPWIGHIPSVSSMTRGKVMLNPIRFDRLSVLPFLREFREELNGMHPFEVLVLKEIHQTMRIFLRTPHVDCTVMPCFDEKGQIVVQKYDGKKIRYESTDDFRRHVDTVDEINQASHFSRNQEEKDPLNTLIYTEAFVTSTNTGQPKEVYLNDIDFKLEALALKYRQFSTCIAPSLYQGISTTIVNEIINKYLPSIATTKLIEDYPHRQITRPGIKGPTHFHNLLHLGNLDLARILLERMNNENVNLNYPKFTVSFADNGQPVSTHPLLWIFTMPGIMDTYSAEAKEEFINCMIDNDVLITDEVAEFLETDRIPAATKQLIYKNYYCRFTKLEALVREVLTADVSGVALRYLVGDTLFERAKSIPLNKTARRPAPQALFQPEPVDTTQEHKSVVVSGKSPASPHSRGTQ